MKNWQIRVIAVASIVCLLWLYVREFPVYDNTIGVAQLVLTSMAIIILFSMILLIFMRKRIVLMEDKWPLVFAALIFPALFAPLFGSLINRLGASEPAERSFIFQKEEPYKMSRFGFLAMLQKESPTGYHLFVSEGDKKFRFRYQKQAYFPLTKPGEVVLLPVKTGLLGFPIVDLK